MKNWKLHACRSYDLLSSKQIAYLYGIAFALLEEPKPTSDQELSCF